MTWLKVESDTPEKPEVRRMARSLEIDPDTVMGKLVRVWAYFDRHTVDGRVDGLVDGDVDAVACMPGFAAAMRTVGWLTSDAETGALVLPNFGRHNGETAKSRALRSTRQARWRSGRVDGIVDGGASTPASTREEKRREEILATPPIPPEGEASSPPKRRRAPAVKVAPVYPPEFETWWGIYRVLGNPGGKLAALRAWQQLPEDDRIALPERTRAYIGRRAGASSRGVHIPFAPHGSTFINGRRWDDVFAADITDTERGKR